jgi:hypothetical protein
MSRRLRGSTSQRRYIFIGDSSSTTGAGLANLVHNSSGLVAYYIAGDLNNEVQITLVTATLGTYTSGGFVAVDNTNMPGVYEIGIPDAALDGGNQVWIQLRGATNMVPVNIYIDLDSVDYQTDAFGALKPTTAGRTLDVSSGGEAGIDLANIGSPTTTVNLSGLTIKTATDIETDTQDIQARLPSALVDGRIAANAQVVGDKTGYSLTQAFPANFHLLGIDGAGAIVTVKTVEELAAGALSANGEIDVLIGGFWNALPSAGYTNGSFGDRVLISDNDNRTVKVTGSGSGHVAADVHAMQPDVVTASALASDAATEIATAVGQLQVLTRLDSMIESDGAGQFRFDTIAMSMAAGGGGGGTDWTSSERTAIRSIFGFDSSGVISLPSVGVLDAIKDKTDLITSGAIQTSLPVTASGQITGPLYIGDDYLQANGRAFSWTVALPTGMVVATATCKLGMDHAEGSESGASFVVTGSVIDAGSGNVELRFDVPKATTGTLVEGFYRWSVEIASAGGNEVTRVANKENRMVEWRAKQT